jgi:hypothetical protein
MSNGPATTIAKITVLATLAASISTARAEESFANLVGKVKVSDVAQDGVLSLPFITWGGDIATFHANGGLSTKPGSIFQKQGLSLKLKKGDDFVQQVREYLGGETPFLRGTFRMIGMASEVIAQDARTKGVVIMQMTWSAGDHMVVRSDVKSAADLKGKRVVLQQGGPHVGLLDDILKTAQISWDDINVTWAKDLTGTPQSPAEMFRGDNGFAACLVITPDMIGLSGGLQNTGSGAEGTVRGARVLVSTAELSRSVADVYVCRKDFYDANTELITKFVAGYFKACEEVLKLKSDYESKGSQPYTNLLQTAQDIYGKDVLPTLEEDAHGLIQDCTFVGYPGNVAFFEDPKNMNGFEAFQKNALALATSRGYAKLRAGLFASGLNYNSPSFKNYLSITEVERKERFRAEAVLEEIEALSAGGGLDDRTIVSFTINFEPNQTQFSTAQYGVEYQRVVEMASKFGNAVIAIRGHSDPTKTLLELVKAGLKKGVLKRTGSKGNYQYSLNGKPLNLTEIAEVARFVERGSFDGVADHNPRATMQAALNLSRRRAEAVRDSVIEHASSKGLQLDTSQIQPLGVGIREPFIAKPSSLDEAKKNMRVEFRLLRVTAEAATSSDFDF